MKDTWSLLIASSVLLTGIGVQSLALFRETPEPREPHLQASVPRDPLGWNARELPLGPNEFVAGEVEKVLNYDEVINREYSRAGERFGVYVAYWSAGKMPTRLVASHTPDRCWTENGMRCVDMRFQQETSFAGGALKPSEWRVFETPNGEAQVHVMYWHLVEGRLYDYGQRFNNVPSPWLWWKDAMHQAVLGSREQYFIRITSSQPFEMLWNDPGFVAVLRGLSELGLAQETGVPIRQS